MLMTEHGQILKSILLALGHVSMSCKRNLIARFALMMIISYCYFSFNAHAQVEGIQYHWEKSIDKQGVRVFSSKVSGSAYRAVKAEMLIDGEVSNLVAMLEDTDNCSNWASLCKEALVVKEISETEYFVYILNAVTFPVADRDLLAHITWSQDSSSGKLTMNSEAISPHAGIDVPKKRGVVRLEKALTQWHFTSQANGKVLVQSYAHIDPNGAVPAWIVNMLSMRAPYQSMMKVRKIIQSGMYDNVVTKLKLM